MRSLLSFDTEEKRREREREGGRESDATLTRFQSSFVQIMAMAGINQGGGGRGIPGGFPGQQAYDEESDDE